MTAAEQIKSYADRILRAMAERDAQTEFIAEIFAEVKSKGHNGPALRKVIMALRMDPEKRKTLEFDIDQYRVAVGLDESASLDEQPRVVAAKMLADGASARTTAKATGLKKSTLQDLSGKIDTKKSPDITNSPAGGGNSSDAGTPTAASPLSPRDAPAGEPHVLAPAAEPDEGWQAKDAAGNYDVAIGELRRKALIARQLPPPPLGEIDTTLPDVLRRQ